MELLQSGFDKSMFLFTFKLRYFGRAPIIGKYFWRKLWKCMECLSASTLISQPNLSIFRSET